MTNLNNINTFFKNKKTIGLVYDIPNAFAHHINLNLPHDAMSEWESKQTIQIIHEHWKILGFEVILFPVDKNFFCNWNNDAKKCTVIHSLVEGYGSLARESWIPSLCELSGIPYIGSNPYVHSICMNKFHVKRVCKLLNIPTAKSYLIRSISDFKKVKNIFFENKHFIKPNAEGSGMGVDAAHSISNHKSQTIQTTKKLLNLYKDGVLLEAYLPGAEYTTGIIGKHKQFLPVAQIEVHDGVYGALNKTKNELCEKVTFPNLDSNITKNLKKYSERLFEYFGMHDMVRFDWKCCANGTPYFLEANTLPGLSKIYSVLPLMAKEAGIGYSEFLLTFFESAYERRENPNFLYGKSMQNLDIKDVSE